MRRSARLFVFAGFASVCGVGCTEASEGGSQSDPVGVVSGDGTGPVGTGPVGTAPVGTATAASTMPSVATSPNGMLPGLATPGATPPAVIPSMMMSASTPPTSAGAGGSSGSGTLPPEAMAGGGTTAGGAPAVGGTPSSLGGGGSADTETDPDVSSGEAGAETLPPAVDAGGEPEPAVDQAALPNVTLFLAGDSTVMTYEPSSAQEGWGQELSQFFIDKVTINNQAIGGASVRTFQSGSRWSNITSSVEAGDYVMIQFGTNDSGSVAGRHVDPADFDTALREMSEDIQGAQATPIFVTPSALQEWSGGMERNTRLGPYAEVMLNLGPQIGVLVDDLNARGVEYLNLIGQDAAAEIYFEGDKAHFTKQGATQMAQFVAEELRRIDSPLADYLK